MDERTEAEHLAQARLEIAKRIKRFCEVFLPADFERLLDQMARLQCKYEVLPGPVAAAVQARSADAHPDTMTGVTQPMRSSSKAGVSNGLRPPRHRSRGRSKP
jgi:hypothetical protein